MGKQVKELSQTQRTINIIIVAALLIYSAVNLYLVITAYSKLDKHVDILGEIIENWQKPSISDIVVANACPTGYESAFKDRYWPGVDNGCWCDKVSDSVRQSKNITCAPFCHSTCTTVQKSAGCDDVTGKAKQLLNFVGTKSSSPMQICLQRSKESWDQIAPISGGSCPSGYTKCGSSADKTFCTKQANCPITSFEIGTLDATTCASNPNCRVLSDTQQLIFKRGSTEDALPLSEFSLNENSMCALKSKANTTPGRPKFGLLAESPSTCGAEGKDKWTSNSLLTEANLFLYNGLNDYITKDLTKYTDSKRSMTGYYPTGKTGSNYNWGMFSRGYVPWKATCRDNMKEFIKKKSFIDHSKTAQLALLIIGAISTVFLGLILSFMEIQNLRGVDLSCIDGKGEEERTKLKRFKKFMNYGFKCVQLPFQIWAIILATGSKSLFASVAASGCSTADINANIEFLAKNLASTHRSNLTALGMLVATLILDLVLAAWNSRTEKADKAVTVINQSPQTQGDLNSTSNVPLQFNNSFGQSPDKFRQQMETQPQQPQSQSPQTIVIQVQGGPGPVAQSNPMQFGGQPQQPAPQQYPPQQQGYPPQQQQYPPPPPQQYPPQQGYPPQQQQYPPPPQQQYPPQQGYPPQQYPAPQQQYPGQY